MAVLVLAWLMAADRPAAAHAIILESQPAAGATVSGPDLDIKLRFNSRLDHERSRMSLILPDGSNETLDITADTLPELLLAHASGLAPGAYRLRWQVLAIDGHITRGEIPFRVADR